MKKKFVLKGRKKFQSLMRGRVLKRGGLTLFVMAGSGRIGVACHSGVKGAVNRNRIKRHLREYARTYILPQIGRRDVLLIANSHTFRKDRIDLGKY